MAQHILPIAGAIMQPAKHGDDRTGQVLYVRLLHSLPADADELLVHLLADLPKHFLDARRMDASILHQALQVGRVPGHVACDQLGAVFRIALVKRFAKRLPDPVARFDRIWTKSEYRSDGVFVRSDNKRDSIHHGPIEIENGDGPASIGHGRDNTTTQQGGMQVTEQGHRPRGRRPGRLDTRGVIQDAALRLFSEQGYEKVSLRAIARAADVDPALIHHYFENKADLFSRSVLDLPLDAEGIVARVLDGPKETTGERMLTEVLAAWDQPGARDRFTAMLRAAVTNPGARRPLSEFLAKELMLKVAEAQGHSNAKLRAQTAVSIVLGLALCRDVLQLTAMARARNSVLINSLGRALQTQLVDTW